MSSVAARYAQRNNNVTTIVPDRLGTINPTNPVVDISGCAVYDLVISTVEYTGGIYVIDLSKNDSSGNPIDFTGLFFPNQIIDPSGTPIPTVAFGITVPHNPAHYPGLEFTIFFKNIPFTRFEGPTLLTIGIVDLSGGPVPYIFSPPAIAVATGNPPETPYTPIFPGVNQSITLKSDGDRFNIVSTGPAGWMGGPNLSAILSIYNTL